jgi:hypothetical protein
MSHFLRPAFLIAVSVLTAQAFGATETLVDPTRPASVAATPAAMEEASGVHVQAVFVRSDSCFAIVNGRLVKAGDHIANISIEAVTAVGVRYTQAGHPGFAAVHTTTLEVRATSPQKKNVP